MYLLASCAQHVFTYILTGLHYFCKEEGTMNLAATQAANQPIASDLLSAVLYIPIPPCSRPPHTPNLFHSVRGSLIQHRAPSLAECTLMIYSVLVATVISIVSSQHGCLHVARLQVAFAITLCCSHVPCPALHHK